MYTSQIGQDRWVQSVLGNISNGFFVELGACDGVEYSNTYFFEKALGWKGICIEPNPSYHEQLSKNRNCSISHYCASDCDDKEIKFSICGAASGVIVTAGPFTQFNEIVKAPTKTLKSILAMNGAPAVIDYLSLDVEGHEYEVMKNFPFNEYIFRCITVEHNEPHTGPAMRQTMRALLEGNGYVFVKGNDDVQGWGHGPIDDFYVHKSVQSQSL
jgi:FkbM family methyltransferase